MTKVVKNLSASVHARLQNIAKERKLPFQEIFYIYAFERFLYRLTHSPYANDFVLKGYLAFLGWGFPLERPTRDIDIQGYTENNIEKIIQVVKTVCAQMMEPDGMRFDPDTIRAERIMAEADYPGVRVYMMGLLGKSEIWIHLDVSFANVITPSSITMNYPCLLDNLSFQLQGYPWETAIAEKFQAMIVLGIVNDRMKDYYDIWFLSTHVNILGSTLVRAIRATFQARKTLLPKELPTALTDEFIRERREDWIRFIRGFADVQNEPSLEQVVIQLRKFLLPPVEAAITSAGFNFRWKRGKSWAKNH